MKVIEQNFYKAIYQTEASNKEYLQPRERPLKRPYSGPRLHRLAYMDALLQSMSR